MSPSVDPKQRFLTTKEFAHEMRMSPRTVQRMIARGDLVISRIGRSVSIPESEVARLRADSLEKGGKPLRKRRAKRTSVSK